MDTGVSILAVAAADGGELGWTVLERKNGGAPPQSGIRAKRDYLISDLLKAAAAKNNSHTCDIG